MTGACAGCSTGPPPSPPTPPPPRMSLDLSALDNDADDVVAAAMLCSWAWSATLADTAGDHRNTVQVQDELWRALRAAPGLVEHSDRITRLGRHRGIVSIQVTHSLDDLDALPTPTDRAKARGHGRPQRDPDPGRHGPPRTRPARRIAALTHPEARPGRLLGRAADLAPRPHPPRPRQIPDQVRATPRAARRACSSPPPKPASTTPTPPSGPSHDPAQPSAAASRGWPATPPHRCCSWPPSPPPCWPPAPSGSPPESPRSWAPAAGHPGWSLALLPRLLTDGVAALVGPDRLHRRLRRRAGHVRRGRHRRRRPGLAPDPGTPRPGRPVAAARARARRPHRPRRPDQGGELRPHLTTATASATRQSRAIRWGSGSGAWTGATCGCPGRTSP